MFHLHGQAQAVGGSQGDSLLCRRREETAPTGRGGAMTQIEEKDTAQSEQGGNPRHRLPASWSIEMYPHRREHDDIESVPALREQGKVRQMVTDPFDPRGWMQPRRAVAEFGSRLDRDHPVAHRG